MSHFSVLVIGDEVARQLAPYDENTEVPMYNEGELDQQDKDIMLEYYRKKGESLSDFNECYRKHGKDWNDNMWKRDIDGVWHSFSTYNPNSKWDWWVKGGRWGNMLKSVTGNFVDSGLKRNITNLDDLSFFAVVKDSQWYENAKMGWWCMTSDEDKDWEDKVKKLLSETGDDELLTIVDCHI